MIVDVERIIVKDRIRKDFGDLSELAADILDNGLINPIVVNRDFVLLAGERRLRAVKRLGWKQVEINMMSTRDAEHELNIEISENDVRKDFSKAERVDYMYRLMRIEKEKARERQTKGENQYTERLRPNLDEASGRTDDATAEKFGIGRTTMRKEMAIVENKDLLTPEDFADWDEGRLSTNKAFQKIKAELDQARKEKEAAEQTAEIVSKQAKETAEENKRLRADNRTLSNRVKPETIVLEPDDYVATKNALDEAESTIENRNAEIANLKKLLRESPDQSESNLYELALDDMERFIMRYEKCKEVEIVIEAMKACMS